MYTSMSTILSGQRIQVSLYVHEYVHYFEWSVYTGFTVCT